MNKKHILIGVSLAVLGLLILVAHLPESETPDMVLSQPDPMKETRTGGDAVSAGAGRLGAEEPDAAEEPREVGRAIGGPGDEQRPAEPPQQRTAESRADGAEDPEPVEAIPGIKGFEIPAENPLVREVRRFVAENVDSAWSADMELRIFNEISQVSGLQIASLSVQCRATMCGVLLVHSDSDNPIIEFPQLRDLGETLGLARQMGFTGFAEDGTLFTAIYVDRWDSSTAQSLRPARPSS